MNIELDIEMIHCGLINVENLAKLVPGLSRHPIYKIALHQLRIGLADTREEKDALQAAFKAETASIEPTS